MASRDEVVAYIGIGSNLGNRREHFRRAAQQLDSHPLCQVRRVSPYYQSVAIGPGEQADYLNAVIELSTSLCSDQLLDVLLLIETRHERTREVRWGPRTLDLDLLLFADERQHSDRLQLPHPRIAERNFVVYPLFDLAPTLVLPDGMPLATIRSKLDSQGLCKLADEEETVRA